MMKKEMTIYKKLLLSYIAVALSVLILTTVPTLVFSTKALKEEISAANIDMFVNSSKVTDSILSYIDNQLGSLGMDANIENFLNFNPAGGSRMSVWELEEIKFAENILKDSRHSNSYIDEIYLYNYNNGRILSSSGSYFSISELSEGSPELVMSSSENAGKWLICDGGSQIMLIRELPMFSPVKNGAIAVRISREKLLETDGDRAALSDLYITDGFFNVISYGENFDSELIEAVNSQKENSGYFSFKGRVAVYYKSEYTMWSYIRLNSTNYLNRTVRNILLYFLALMLLFMVIAYFMIKKLTTNVYAPIKNTVKMIEDIIEEPADSDENELEYLIQSFEKMNVKRQGLEAALRGNTDIIKTKFIINLAEGVHYLPQQIKNNLENLNLSFDSPYFTAAVFVIDNFSEFSAEFSEKDRKLWRYGILNIIEEMVNQKYSGAAVELCESKLLILINSGEKELSYELFSDIIRTIKTHLEISLSCGVGKAADKIEDAPVSYKQSLEALKHKTLTGPMSVNFYTEENPANTFDFNFDYDKLSNYVKASDMTKISEILDEWERNIRDAGFVDLDIILANANIIIAWVYKKAGGENRRQEIIYKKIEEIETLSQVKEWILETISDLINDNYSHPIKSRYIDDITAYVNEHYTEDISLDILSDALGISAPYISTIVNSELGITFVQLVNNKRIEKAKEELVANPSASIDEIRSAVGFNSIHTFMRAFKKSEGISPGMYRNKFKN